HGVTICFQPLSISLIKRREHPGSIRRGATIHIASHPSTRWSTVLSLPAETFRSGRRRYDRNWSFKSKTQHRLGWKLNLSCFGHGLDPARSYCGTHDCLPGKYSNSVSRLELPTDSDKTRSLKPLLSD